METSTIRIAIRGLNEPWDRSRIPAVLDEIEAVASRRRRHSGAPHR